LLDTLQILYNGYHDMEFINFDSVNLADQLSQIPDSVKNGLPFGLIKVDFSGTILEYNMAEGDLMGIDPDWAIGKNFFEDVATCTKPEAFYGRFAEGVKKGFLNVVFDYLFNHRGVATSVKVAMVTMPDYRGQKVVAIMIKRTQKPFIVDALSPPVSTTVAPAVPASAFDLAVTVALAQTTATSPLNTK
jgi:photoactive yellow protein